MLTFEYMYSRLKHLTGILKRLPLNQQLIITGLAVGMATGVTAYFYDRLVEGVIFLSTRADGLSAFWRVTATLLVPAFGGLVAGVITHIYCTDAKGHGVMEVVTALKEKEGHIPARVAWSKMFASAATLGSGGSTGREGPIVQIGATVGSVMGRAFGVSKEDLKALVAAGAAGGLAATFSIPLAAVFFVMEVLLRNFANEAFPAIVISSVTAAACARVLLGGSAFITPVSYQWKRPSEFIFYAALGLICAPIGLFYRKSVDWFEHAFEKMTVIPDWVRPAIGGLVVGALALYLPQIRGTGQGTLNSVLLGQTVGWGLAALAVGKILATSLTLGSGGSGGGLMPSLFVGAMTGGVFSAAVQKTFGMTIEPGALALVGMAAVFTAAFDAPITAIIMAFEITRDYGILMPVMFGCVISYISARRNRVHI